jgi:hypothetical protein
MSVEDAVCNILDISSRKYSESSSRQRRIRDLMSKLLQSSELCDVEEYLGHSIFDDGSTLSVDPEGPLPPEFVNWFKQHWLPKYIFVTQDFTLGGERSIRTRAAHVSLVHEFCRRFPFYKPREIWDEIKTSFDNENCEYHEMVHESIEQIETWEPGADNVMYLEFDVDAEHRKMFKQKQFQKTIRKYRNQFRL